VDGSGYKELKVGNGLAALAVIDDMLFWMTVDGNRMYLFYFYLDALLMNIGL